MKISELKSIIRRIEELQTACVEMDETIKMVNDLPTGDKVVVRICQYELHIPAPVATSLLDVEFKGFKKERDALMTQLGVKDDNE